MKRNPGAAERRANASPAFSQQNPTPRRTGRAALSAASLLYAWPLLALHSTAALVSSFQVGDSGWHLGTLGVGRLDGSGQPAIVVPHRDSSGNWYLDAFKYNGQHLPGFPYAAGTDPINVSPTLYDLDHDGRDEIIFTRGNQVVVLRGDGSVMWSRTVDASNYVPTGGYQTVLGGFYWYPTGTWLSRLPSTANFSSQVSSPVVADLNGTGNLEILTAWKILPDPSGAGQDYNPFIGNTYGVIQWGATGEGWSGGIVGFAANSGTQTFTYHIHQLVESGLAVGRASASGPLKIYELNDSDSVVCFDKSQPFGLWGKGMLHKQFGKNQRLISGSYQAAVDVNTADLDGDGLDEALVAGTQVATLWQPNETILDDDGAILWRRWLPYVSIPNNFGWLNNASLIPCNPDHDNHVDVLGFNHSYEVTFRYWNGIELVDRPGWPKNFYPYLPTPPVVGDVDGDGAEEIVLGTYNPSANPSDGTLYIFALDGTLKQSVAVAGGLKHIPALADVEGNGRLDVVYRSLNGTVSVQNFGATGTNAVSWATHRGNMHRDGNRGLSLYPPGTPLVTRKTSGHNRTSFSWSSPSPVQAYRIYRAEQPAGPFVPIASVPATTTNYTDYGLRSGWQYVYEVGAVYATNTVHSAPFAILSLLNGNLLANAGFEENDNSHWDKWFTGDVGMTNMSVSTNIAYQGQRSMQVLLQNNGANSTISQFCQYGIPDSTLYVTPGAWYSYGGYFKSTGISQPSEHWLEWYSSKTGSDTNDRPALPYPFYFTPHYVVGTTQSDWGYVNRTFQVPAGFPNVELRHHYSVPAPASGSIYLDNLFFRQIPAPAATNWTRLLPFGSTWRFASATPPANWTATNFNDTSWPSGQAKLGNGSGPANLVTRLPQYQPTYYFRTTFNLATADFEELLLAATCTDTTPPRLFLNGSEVKSPMDVVTLQGNEVRYFDLTPFAALLHPGTNTIAVQLPNYFESGWDDIAFDLCLQAVTACYPNTGPRLQVQCSNAGTPNLSVNTPVGTVWQLQSSDGLSPCNWQVMHTFTNLTDATQVFSDLSPNGQPVSGQVGQRFYRLVPF